MGLDGSLSIAIGGLADVNQRMAIVSQNISNASTPSYAVELPTQQSLQAGGQGMGVFIGPAVRNVDQAVQAQVSLQTAIVAKLQQTQSAMQSIDAVQGTVTDTASSSNALPSLLGNLESAFSSLQNDPSAQAQQSAVVSSANTLATQIQTLAGTYTTLRQTAQNDIVSSITTLNQALDQIGTLSVQIINLKAQKLSTADLENQRDAQIGKIAGLVGVKVFNQDNGDVLLTTSTGLILPTKGVTNPFTTSGANIGPSSTLADGTIPKITLGGQDVTSQLTDGQVGADITLRDSTLPLYQAELDEFSQNLASRFSAQGLSLFTDASGNVPAAGTTTPVQSGYVGFSSYIQVNPAVTTTPSLVRDGTDAISGNTNQTTGQTTGASDFTPNDASTGLAGFTTLISRVLNYTFGTDVAAGTTQPTTNVTGLGQDGTLSAPYVAPLTLVDIASNVVSSQSHDSANVTSQLTSQTAYQAALSTTLQSSQGVNMDSQLAQLVQLQNAYGANARVISTVQALFILLEQIPT